MLNFENNCT